MASHEMTVFQKALLDSVLSEYQDIPQEQELIDRYSIKFHLWADDFIKKQDSKKLQLHRTLRIALIAAVLMALLVGTALAIPVVREAILDYFIQTREDSYGIMLDPESAATAPDVIETVYAVRFIPEGYDLTIDARHPKHILLCWNNATGQSITFSQYTIGDRSSDSQWIGMGNPDDPRKQVLIEEYIVDVIDQGDVYSFLWTNNEYFFIMHIPTDIYWDTMVKIVESVSPVT